MTELRVATDLALPVDYVTKTVGILAVVVDAWPNEPSVPELAAAAGYEPTGGAFRNPLGKLRTLELLTRGGPTVSLTDEFAEAIGLG